MAKRSLIVWITTTIGDSEFGEQQDATFQGEELAVDVEGIFSLPLAVDSEVSEVGLYFDGKRRNAVAVERVQARAAYKQTDHRRVDRDWPSPSTRFFRFRVSDSCERHHPRLARVSVVEHGFARPRPRYARPTRGDRSRRAHGQLAVCRRRWP